jgi:hypothetical protein
MKYDLNARALRLNENDDSRGETIRLLFTVSLAEMAAGLAARAVRGERFTRDR